MAKAKKSENVPSSMQEKFDDIVAITNDFAKQHLDLEYAVRRKLGLVALPML